MQQNIEGIWRLVYFQEQRANGEWEHAIDPEAHGTISYWPNGRMQVPRGGGGAGGDPLQRGASGGVWSRHILDPWVRSSEELARRHARFRMLPVRAVAHRRCEPRGLPLPLLMGLHHQSRCALERVCLTIDRP